MSLLESDHYLEYIDDSIDAEVDSYYDEYLEHDEELATSNHQLDLLQYEQLSGKQVPPRNKQVLDREDPFQINDLEFYKTYRFSKDSVRKLTKLLFPSKKKNNRGLPFDPEQVVCTALKHLGGVSFKHLYKGGTKATGLRHFYTFMNAVNKYRDELIKMPSVETMTHSINSLWERYHLWNIVGTLGSTQINLSQKPRGLPDGDLAKVYKTKSGHYALNINFASGIENCIYYACITPAAELSPSWDDSNAKSYLESMNPAVHLLGEPNQILSNTVITPFSRWESTQDQTKALFNLRHSMGRSEMTHKTVQLWLKRFPRLLNPNYKIHVVKQMLEATLILHNLSVLWDDPLPPELLARNPPIEPVHTVHEDIQQKYFTESSIQIREELLATCLQGNITEDEKQVLELTMPVQIILPRPEQQDYTHHSVFFSYPTPSTEEVTIHNIS